MGIIGAPSPTRGAGKAGFYEWALRAGLTAGVVFSVAVLFARLNSGWIERHEFRQAQTALGAYWLTQGGPWFGYETAMFGYPWSSPFEFPVYQWIVASLTLAGAPLNVAARLVNWAFFAGALALGAGAMRRLGAAREFTLTFAILVLFSPLYAFWSRTIMMESTALFFAALFLFGLVRYLEKPGLAFLALMFAGAVLGALVKITTFFAFALAGGAIVLTHAIKLIRIAKSPWPAVRAALAPAAAILASIALLALWVHYSDALKAQNPLAIQTTSKSLTAWNYGTLAQKLDPVNWLSVLVARTPSEALGTPLALSGAVLAVLAFARRQWMWLAAALALYAADFAVFTNVQIIHNYYQYANAVFCILAVAAAIHGIATLRMKGAKIIALALLAALIGAQTLEFAHAFWPIMSADQAANRSTPISRRVAQRTKPEDVIFVFGYDSDPIIASMAKRRSVTFAARPKELAAVLAYPLARWTGGRPIGAVIDCEPDPNSPLKAIVARAARGLKGYGIEDCIAFDRVGAAPGERAYAPYEAPKSTTDAALKPLGVGALLAGAGGANAARAERIEEPSPAGPKIGVSAFAPTSFTLSLPPGARVLVVDFGLRGNAWGEDDGGAICFAIEAEAPLWRRCLAPARALGDRGMQEVSVALPANVRSVRLQTIAANGVSAGWPYWADPRVK